jgi:hypothetical protein
MATVKLMTNDYYDVKGAEKIKDNEFKVIDKDVYIVILPYFEDVSNNAFVIKLGFKDEELITYPKNINIIHEGTVYEIYINSEIRKQSVMTKAIEQQTLSFNSDTFTTTLYFEENYRLLIENSDDYYQLNIIETIANSRLPKIKESKYQPLCFECDIEKINNLDKCVIKCQAIGNTALFILKCILNSKYDYMLIISYDNAFHILGSIIADNINVLQDRISAKTKYSNMSGTIKTVDFAINHGVLQVIGTSFENTLTQSYISELLPYLFMESIMIGDLITAKNCLGENLKNDLQDIIDFMGKFTHICNHLGENTPLNQIKVFDCNEKIAKIKNFKFELFDGKITNIEEI